MGNTHFSTDTANYRLQAGLEFNDGLFKGIDALIVGSRIPLPEMLERPTLFYRDGITHCREHNLPIFTADAEKIRTSDPNLLIKYIAYAIVPGGLIGAVGDITFQTLFRYVYNTPGISLDDKFTKGYQIFLDKIGSLTVPRMAIAAEKIDTVIVPMITDRIKKVKKKPTIAMIYSAEERIIAENLQCPDIRKKTLEKWIQQIPLVFDIESINSLEEAIFEDGEWAITPQEIPLIVSEEPQMQN